MKSESSFGAQPDFIVILDCCLHCIVSLLLLPINFHVSPAPPLSIVQVEIPDAIHNLALQQAPPPAPASLTPPVTMPGTLPHTPGHVLASFTESLKGGHAFAKGKQSQKGGGKGSRS